MEQKTLLEKFFKNNPYPSIKEKRLFAMTSNISNEDLLNFFRNKRSKERKNKRLDNLKLNKITSLLYFFENNQCPSNQEILELSFVLDLPEKFITSWFVRQRFNLKIKK